MRKHLLIVALVLMAFTTLFAQRESAEEFLTATDEMIAEHAGDFEEAPEVVADLYEMAVESQEEAWDLYEEGEEMGAMTLSHTARAQLRHALRMLEHGGECPGPGEPGERMIERVEDALDRTDEVIEDATEDLGEDASEDAIELLNQAIVLQAEAREAFDAEEYPVAMRKTASARSLAIRATRIDGGHHGHGGGHGRDYTAEAVLASLEMTDEVIESNTAEIEASENEDAIELLEEAIELQAEAYESYEEEEFAEAMRLTHTARSLVERANRMIDRETPDEDVAAELDETDSIIEEATPIIEESGDEIALAMLERAIELQASARENYDEGNNIAALHQTHNARRIIERALDLIEDIEDED